MYMYMYMYMHVHVHMYMCMCMCMRERTSFVGVTNPPTLWSLGVVDGTKSSYSVAILAEANLPTSS